MSTRIKDIRNSARMLGRSPGFTLVAAVALAVGIGANTETFSVVSSNLLRALPFCDPASLVKGLEKSARGGGNVVSPASYPDWKSRNRVFGDLAALVDIFSINLTGSGDPEVLAAGAVTVNFFQMIGVQPVIGRAFVAGEGARGRQHGAGLIPKILREPFAGAVGGVGKSITLN